MTAAEHRRHKLDVGRDASLGFLLAVVAGGNIILPEKAQSFLGVDYLIPSALILSVIIGWSIFRGLNLWHLLPALPFLVLVLFGFLGHQLDGYALAKALGLVIATLLVLAPSAGRDGHLVIKSALVTLTIGASVLSFLVVAIGSTSLNGRGSVFEMNPIAIARSGALVATIALVGLLHPRVNPKIRVASLLLLGVGTYGAAVTGSRGPLAALAAGAAVTLVALLLRGRINPWAMLFIAAGTVGAWVALTSSTSASIARLASSDGSGRTDLWSQTIEVARQNPFGIGWGNLGRYVTGYAPDVDDRLYPHNIFLEIWSEAGTIGIACFVMLLVVCLIRLIRWVRKSGDSLSLACFAVTVYLLTNAMVSSDVVGNRTLWLFLGIALLQGKRTTTSLQQESRRKSVLAAADIKHPRPVSS